MRSEKFFKHISSYPLSTNLDSGGTEGIKKIDLMIKDDPKQHMYNEESPYHIVNRYNTFKQTPLYVAAKYGHLDVIQFLLRRNANPHIYSLAAPNEYESILEVSVRWSHV